MAQTMRRSRVKSLFEAPELAERSSAAFRAFLLGHQLSFLRVALSANIHVVSVYNIAVGVPVQPAHEAAVRVALHRLTGEHYTAFIFTVPAPDQKEKSWQHKLKPF